MTEKMSPVSLEDIMEFMKKEKEDRAKEREADKEEIRNMIIKGVREEVQSNIKSFQDKQEVLEFNQADMKEKFDELVEVVKNLQSKVETPQTNTGAEVPGPHSEPSLTVHRPSYLNEQVLQGGGQDPKVKEIIDFARRTVGLCSIDSEDLARMRQDQYGGATTEEEEKLLAVKEYLRCELKISNKDIEEMEIENIFVPASEKHDPRSLNVTFRNYSSVIRIYEKTRIMRKGSRINNYIPRQFHDTLRAISAIDYQLREDGRYQTRIKMGLEGLELHKELRGSRKWERVSLPDNLPPVNLSGRPTTASDSTSPPPGRPRLGSTREKRGRDSNSSDTEQHVCKVAKKNKEEKNEIKKLNDTEKSAKESQERSKDVLPCQDQGKDPGNVTDIQGTPVKALSTHSYLESPIFSRSKIIK